VVTECRPETVPEKTVFDSGKTAVDASDSCGDKRFSHGTPPSLQDDDQLLSGTFSCLLPVADAGCAFDIPGACCDIGASKLDLLFASSAVSGQDLRR